MPDTNPSHRDTTPGFIVGCGRSGTTLLYETVCKHPASGWVSQFTQRPQLLRLAGVQPAIGRLPLPDRLRPRPVEGYRIYDWATEEIHGRHGFLDAAQAVPSTTSRLREISSRHSGPSRTFVNKNTRNTRWLGLLVHAHPSANVVHVLRDPRSVTASLLRVPFWPTLPLWYLEGHPIVSEIAEDEVDEARLAATLWVREVTAALESQPPGTLEVRYERLINNFVPETLRVATHLGLPDDRRFRQRVESVQVRTGPLERFRTDLTPAQLDAVSAVAGDLADALGYSL